MHGSTAPEPVEHVQTQREIIATLTAAGLRPRKRLGQHFLIDGNLMRRLVASAELMPQDSVLEVGGGTGALTELLARRVGRVLCVEIDGELLGILEERVGQHPGVTLLRGDVLESKHRLAPQVDRFLHDAATEEGGSGRAMLVANLPYQVATPLVMNLLVDYPQVRRLCFTVQAEVGERITARHGGKAYGPLSIVSQALCTIRTVAELPPHTFWPQPAVSSVMLRMDVGESPLASREEVRRFAALVRGAFDHRRKTLRSALGFFLDEAARARACQSIDANRRPESLSVAEWLALYRALVT